MELENGVARSDSVHIEDAGSLVIVTASGLFGLAACLEAMTRVRSALADGPAAAVLVDLRAAALTIGPVQYLELLRAALTTPVRRPVAFVVGPGLMRFGDAHCLLMGRRGLARRFFPSIGPALRWLGSRRTPQRSADLLG